ncbi:MAG: nuclear transport factor 2 family protein [Chloroflexota bacterium]|nr:nuclear transport factor 2 family protein [Chloroflexota bacterium]
MSSRSSDAEAVITQLIMAREGVIHDKNLDALITQSDPAVRAFDVMAPLSWSGLDPLRKKLTGWFTGYDGPIGYDIRDLKVTATDDLGFAHYVYNVTGTLNDGDSVDMWVRATVCLVKQDGEWRITHEHTSVPYDPQSGKALTDLQPE